MKQTSCAHASMSLTTTSWMMKHPLRDGHRGLLKVVVLCGPGTRVFGRTGAPTNVVVPRHPVFANRYEGA